MRRRPHAHLPFALLWLAITLFDAATAAARDAPRVLMIDPGSELERAARAALEPWQVEISAISAPSPGSSAPRLHERAEALARAQSAATVVWISEHEAGYALWVYDAASRHVVARPLNTAPPIAGAQAAAVALTLKTLLRHSESAPVEERYGATPPTRAAARVVAPSHAAVSDEIERPSARAPRGPSHVEPDASLAMRFAFAAPGSKELRAGLGAVFWPRAKLGGVALRAAFGNGTKVSGARFVGTLTSITLSLGGRIRWEPQRWLRVSAGVAALVDVTRLQGATLREQQRAPDQWRAVPALAPELELAWLALPWLRIGLRATPAWLVRPARYWLTDRRLPDELIVTLPNFTYEGALVLSFGDHDP